MTVEKKTVRTASVDVNNPVWNQDFTFELRGHKFNNFFCGERMYLKRGEKFRLSLSINFSSDFFNPVLEDSFNGKEGSIFIILLFYIPNKNC